MIEKYISLPVEIEAMQITEDLDIKKLCNFWPQIRIHAYKKALNLKHELTYFIKTLEGEMEGRVGDWIIKGTIGEFYFCKDEVFRKKYMPKQSIETSAGDGTQVYTDHSMQIKCPNCEKWFNGKNGSQFSLYQVIGGSGHISTSSITTCKDCSLILKKIIGTKQGQVLI